MPGSACPAWTVSARATPSWRRGRGGGVGSGAARRGNGSPAPGRRHGGDAGQEPRKGRPLAPTCSAAHGVRARCARRGLGTLNASPLGHVVRPRLLVRIRLPGQTRRRALLAGDAWGRAPHRRARLPSTSLPPRLPGRTACLWWTMCSSPAGLGPASEADWAAAAPRAAESGHSAALRRRGAGARLPLGESCTTRLQLGTVPREGRRVAAGADEQISDGPGTWHPGGDWRWPDSLSQSSSSFRNLCLPPGTGMARAGWAGPGPGWQGHGVVTEPSDHRRWTRSRPATGGSPTSCGLGEADLVRPSGCAGWAVTDPLFDEPLDAQRRLWPLRPRSPAGPTATT